MNTCKSCKWWGVNLADAHLQDGYGSCDFPEMLEDVRHQIPADDNAYCYTNEPGNIMTGPNFGCIHHEPK